MNEGPSQRENPAPPSPAPEVGGIPRVTVHPSTRRCVFDVGTSRVARIPLAYDPAKAKKRPINLVMDEFTRYMQLVCITTERDLWVDFVANQALPPAMTQEWVEVKSSMLTAGLSPTWQQFMDWTAKYMMGNPKEERLQFLMNLQQKSSETFSSYRVRWEVAYRQFESADRNRTAEVSSFSKMVMLKQTLTTAWKERLQVSSESIDTYDDLCHVCTGMEKASSARGHN